ncbi:hypothetical protein [Prauserella cavernicola]|uniref:Uncharacterized protein n=1 Tax=Prauserella cavernicola TaxID=2800127 RepID=A0A934QUC6_9PSEU|nr:hypothetical protein [Prauserella cavernicola]MBK1786650.1 hypothetical protein [Prauserella cavernicola]
MDLDQMVQQSDPAKTLDSLLEAGTIAGAEPGQDVDGVSTTKYTVDVDFDRAMEQSGMSGELDQLPVDFEVDTIPVSVWIDERDLPLRVDVDMTEAIAQAAAQAEGSPMADMFDTAVISMKYYDWGAPVTVEAPPADQVEEATVN